jgi:hypothetical protein
MAKKPPRLGGELPAYTTMGATTPTTPKKPVQRMLRTLAMGKPGMGKTVQRSPRENLGTPGTKNFVQRSPKVNIGTPGTKNFVQRTPANSSQRMPSSVMNTLRSKLTAPRKPAK